MYPMVPAELMQNAVQFVAYFVTVVGIVFGVMLGSRA
jgi:hypothetical protein